MTPISQGSNSWYHKGKYIEEITSTSNTVFMIILNDFICNVITLMCKIMFKLINSNIYQLFVHLRCECIPTARMISTIEYGINNRGK